MVKVKKRKEIEPLQKLKLENQKLKRQLARLRKQIDRLDLDRYQNIKELLECQQEETEGLRQKSQRDLLREKWQCFKCEDGYLRLLVISRPDGIFYFRACKECGNKTRLKKHHKGVEGITE